MKRLALVALVVCITVSVQARLLETKEQMVKRYGEPIQESKGQICYFKKDNLKITVFFGQPGERQGQVSVEGLVVSEFVSLPDNTGEFSDQALFDILAVNSGGSAWGYLSKSTRTPSMTPRTNSDSVRRMSSLPTVKQDAVWADLKILPSRGAFINVVTKDNQRAAKVGRSSIELTLQGIAKPQLRPQEATVY